MRTQLPPVSRAFDVRTASTLRHVCAVQRERERDVSTATQRVGVTLVGLNGRYGGATSRGSRSPTEVTVSYQDWVETFLPAFKAVLSAGSAHDRQRAQALSTMCS